MTTMGSGAAVPHQAFEAFRYFEEAAEKTKAHAWSQTTWLLALNTAIFAFSVNLYAEHGDLRGFLLIECISACVGVLLCAFLIYLLEELGKHIKGYWISTKRITDAYPQLDSFAAVTDPAAKEPTPTSPSGSPSSAAASRSSSSRSWWRT